MGKILLELLFGFGALFLGATISLKYSIKIAYTLQVPKIVVAVALIAFGTSLPEAVVSLIAASSGATELVLGNILGSNIANLGLVLGVACLIRSIPFERKKITREIIAMFLASAALIFFLYDGMLSRMEGGLLFLGLIVFNFFLFRNKDELLEAEGVPEDIHEPNLPKELGFAIAGLALLVFGAKLFVNGSIDIAQYFKIPEWLIGFTVVAIGTSLPELAAVIVASLQKESPFILGNVFGSNILNILFVLSLSVMLNPILIGSGTFNKQIVLFIGFTLLPCLFIFTGKKLNRWHGLLFLGSFIGYIFWIGNL